MLDAPLYTEIAQGPCGGKAYWLSAEDAVRLRVGHWAATPGTSTKGTVLIFPGRTEYIEKYGLIARELSDQGFHSLAIDWRGQGLADRPDQDRALAMLMILPNISLMLRLPSVWRRILICQSPGF